MKKITFLLVLLIGITLFSNIVYAIDHTVGNVAWYVFANQSNNETALRDKSGHGFNLTEKHNPSWNSSDGYKFDGANDYLIAGPNQMFGNKFTIAIWFKPVSVSSYKFEYSYARGDASVAMEILGGLGGNTKWKEWTQIAYQQSGPTIRKFYLTGNDVFQTGKTYQAVTTWDGTNYKMYINGTQDTSVTKDTDDAITLTNQSRYFCVATNCYDLTTPALTQFSDDKILAIQVWSTNKSASDISDLYTQGANYNPYAGGGSTTSIAGLSAYNITSNVWGVRTGWNAGKKNVNVTSSSYSAILTGTLTTNVSSNCSIGNTDKNYTSMVAANSNTKLATTATTSHSFAYYYNITDGTQCVYLSCLPVTNGRDTPTSNSGCLNVTYDAHHQWTYYGLANTSSYYQQWNRIPRTLNKNLSLFGTGEFAIGSPLYTKGLSIKDSKISINNSGSLVIG